MKLRTQMQKANVITVVDGVLQTQFNGCVFQEYIPKFKGLEFAVNAKDFFTALDKLNDNFRVSVSLQDIALFDDLQDFILKKELCDMIIPIKAQGEQLVSLGIFMELRAYATQDYPAFFLFKDTLEVLHPSMIVRAPLPGNEIVGSFSLCDFPKENAQLFHDPETGLQINFNGPGRVWLGDLKIDKPDTDFCFDHGWPLLEEIPAKLKARWVPCELVTFTPDGVELDDLSTVEQIVGMGKYDGKLFGKVLRNAKHWAFSEQFMYFQGDHHYGVLENVNS